jgi:hypothetical protein
LHSLHFFTGSLFATLAQLVEHLICNHEVVGSIPIGGFAEGFCRTCW